MAPSIFFVLRLLTIHHSQVMPIAVPLGCRTSPFMTHIASPGWLSGNLLLFSSFFPHLILLSSAVPHGFVITFPSHLR